MRIGCDLHARQQTLVIARRRTKANQVRKVRFELPRPVLVGIEAIGPIQRLSGSAGAVGNRLPGVGDAAKIRAAEPRKAET